MYVVQSLRTFLGTNAERTGAGLAAFLPGDEFIETDTNSIYIFNGMAWVSKGGGGTPGGSDTQLQYNNGGAFGGAAQVIYDDSNHRLGVGGTPSAKFQVNEPTAATRLDIVYSSQIDSIGGVISKQSYIGKNDAAADTEYIKIETGIEDETAGSETATYNIYRKINGSLASVFSMGSTNEISGATYLNGTAFIGSLGNLASFNTSAIRLNDAEADVDISWGGNGVTNGYYYDAGNNRHGFGTGAPTNFFQVEGAGVFNVTTGGAGVELFKVASSNESGYFSVSDGATSGFLPQFEFAANGLAAGGVMIARIPTGSDTFNAALAAMIIDGRLGATGATGPSNANVLIVRGGATPFLTVGPTGVVSCNATTGAFIPNVLTTTQRNALTAVNGMLIYNSTTGKFQGRAAGSWVDLH